MTKTLKTILRGAFLTVATLFSGLLIGLVLGDLVFRLIPGSSVKDVKLGHAAAAAVPALGGFLIGGAAWGLLMGKIAGSAEKRRLAWAGILGFGPISILLATILGVAEPQLVQMVNQPIHRVFTLLFVPSAFLIAGISAWSIGIGLRDRQLAWVLFWQVGVSAALSFLTINLIMEALGWVVGAPGAADRATMITVLALGNIGAALVGGAVMGWRLSKLVLRSESS